MEITFLYGVNSEFSIECSIPLDSMGYLPFMHYFREKKVFEFVVNVEPNWNANTRMQ